MIMMIIYTDHLDFTSVFATAQDLSVEYMAILNYKYSVLDVIVFSLFIGAMGKSAQIGLHVWLPDAMEGPTPVSALIHAATMVTAGVFLVARCSYLFEYSERVLEFVAIIGGVTCLFAATIAIAQDDIKKIIAYSTCSQLGYMFLACGVSAYGAGIFHLVTHAFFKALLFLSAGSVIHAVDGEQNIFNMGGLKKKLPVTYGNFWIGSLALVGIFPLSGFYSKDLILESAYGHSEIGNFVFILGIIAACLTAIYSMKIIILVFHGESRLPKDVYRNAHESPSVMNVPLILLVFGSMAAGAIGHYVLSIGKINGYFGNSIFYNHFPKAHDIISEWVAFLPILVGVFGIILGILCYKLKIYEYLAKYFKWIYYLLNRKYYIDEIYTRLIVNVVFMFSKLFNFADIQVIDRLGVRSFGNLAVNCGAKICRLQTGYIFHYAAYILLAVVIAVTSLVVSFSF